MARGFLLRTVSTVSTSAAVLAFCLVLAVCPFLSGPGEAAEPNDLLAQRAGEIVLVMQGARPPGDTFDDRFLADVSPDKLAAFARQLEADNGRLIAAEGVRAENSGLATFRLRFERAEAIGHVTLEAAAPYKVAGFRITSVLPIADTAEKIVADFAALPGRAGFAVVRLGDRAETLLAHRDDEQFAIASAFKLWVLDALAHDVARGRRRWDAVVRLDRRSLPGGIMQDWPDGASATVETLATLMISISDNTATDTLIRLVGRKRIGQRLRATGHADPARMLPLLTTAEAFALKLSPPTLREAYARADDAEQARILARLDAPRVFAGADIRVLDAAPVAIDSVEWFASPGDIARVLDSLRRRKDPRVLQILGVTPAMAPELRRGFGYVGYKGGSEAGVLNLTWLLRHHSGEWIAVTASWNDPDQPLDQRRLEALAQRLIRLAAADQLQTIAP